MSKVQELIDSTENKFDNEQVEFSSIYPEAFVTIYSSATNWRPDELRELATVLDAMRKEPVQ